MTNQNIKYSTIKYLGWLTTISILLCTPLEENQPINDTLPEMYDRGYTVKFGDHFDIDELTHSRQLLVKDPEVLCKEIQFRVENEKELKTIEKTKYRFFGDNKDGAQWIVEQLKKLQ